MVENPTEIKTTSMHNESYQQGPKKAGDSQTAM